MKLKGWIDEHWLSVRKDLEGNSLGPTGKPYLRYVNFVILRYTFLNNYTLTRPDI
jgi:hypothetical protein